MKKATLYRMFNAQHICPFGIRCKYLLKKHGYSVEDKLLKSREEVDAFKKKYNIKTTPQTFIDGKRIGGHDDLLSFLNLKTDKEKKTYTPIIVVFAMTFLMTLCIHYTLATAFNAISVLEMFVALSMCTLALLKLRDLYAFTNQFITYDLLGMKSLHYAYTYPFAETFIGLSMLAKTLSFIAAPIAFVVGSIGTVSVIKAVYLDKRDLKCACVGGNSNVPLGFISLTENITMIAVSIWMLIY